jgi:hypothetical protein
VTCNCLADPHLSQALDWPIQVHIGVLVNLDQEAAQFLQSGLNNLRLLNTLHKEQAQRTTPTLATHLPPHAFGRFEQDTTTQGFSFKAPHLDKMAAVPNVHALLPHATTP